MGDEELPPHPTAIINKAIAQPKPIRIFIGSGRLYQQSIQIASESCSLSWKPQFRYFDVSPVFTASSRLGSNCPSSTCTARSSCESTPR